MLTRWVDRLWYRSTTTWVGWLLLPLSWLFRLIARRRREHYQRQELQGQLWQPPVPVIVVGNISVGGTGKTPVVIALLDHLRHMGLRPGVVSRGYGADAPRLPLLIDSGMPATQCGDEPLLIHLRTGCPVVIDPDRVSAVRHLLVETDVDVVVSDDGLQHYRLHRDIELAVVDGQRGLGNGRCLPAGPLREPPGRLGEVDLVLLNGGGVLPAAPDALAFTLRPTRFVNVKTGESVGCERFGSHEGSALCVHAVAGIGNPERFFNSLRTLGFTVDGHAFADHHHYRVQDFAAAGDRMVVMTEKDAVKCRAFASERYWYLAVDAELPASFAPWLMQRLQSGTVGRTVQPIN